MDSTERSFSDGKKSLNSSLSCSVVIKLCVFPLISGKPFNVKGLPSSLFTPIKISVFSFEYFTRHLGISVRKSSSRIGANKVRVDAHIPKICVPVNL
ncbi:hypothetical protein GDO81_024791 [Engystomops pustulosus]|uniref:Uncharacterized protein n=1 Tax=Engystomops pustulosus TaxID=76066 RepID=A0AAV6YKT0_ENGPU|nr:hypothetical protein GDO81_024791 [Engystomops pustulosus]